MMVVHSRGRGLDDARTREIYAAAAEVLADVGYERLTMDAVAHRAKASKATLYRRWDSKAELVTEAVQAVRGDGEQQLPDTGNLRDDLRAFVARVGEQSTQSQVCMMRGLVSACSSDQALARAVRQQLVETKRVALLSLLSRAQQRGQIPHDRDLEFLVDILPASLMYRFLVTYQPVDSDFLDRLVDDIALPLLADDRTHSAVAQPMAATTEGDA